MKIFQPLQTWMLLMGYLSTYSQSSWYLAYNILIYVLTAALFSPILAYIITNITDVSAVAESLSLFSGELNALAKGVVLLSFRQKLRRLFEALQRNFDQKEAAGRSSHYLAMDRIACTITKINIGWMTNSICAICLGPMIVIAYHGLIVGDLRPDMYRQPIGLVFPFDMLRSPAYQIVYVMMFMSTTCIGYTISMTNCIFMCVCTQIIACQKDLQDMLGEMDVGSGGCVENDGQDGGKNGAGAVGGRTRRRSSVLAYSALDSMRIEGRLKDCVRFHYEIDSFVRNLSTIASRIIFAQFILSVLQMGTLAFQIQVGENLSIDRQIANVVTGLVVFTELLIYCYFGNEVAVQGVRVAQAAYDSAWYKCDVRMRRFVLVIMMRAQQPHVFSGAKMVTCSLSTYTTVLNMVGSSVALLRSVV